MTKIILLALLKNKHINFLHFADHTFTLKSWWLLSKVLESSENIKEIYLNGNISSIEQGLVVLSETLKKNNNLKI